MRAALAALFFAGCVDESTPGDDVFAPALGQWVETDLVVESDSCGTGEVGSPTGFVLETGTSSDFVLIVLDEALEETDLVLACFAADQEERLDCTAEPYEFAAGGATLRIEQGLVVLFADEEHADE